MAQSARVNDAPSKNSETLADALRDRIISGELEPGQRLGEVQLAAELGISRIPLREALRELAAEGFVRSEYYGGTFVAQMDIEAAHDLLDVRAALEPLAAAQAAMRCAPDHLESLYHLIDEGDRAFREKRFEDVRQWKLRFFEQLALASQNATLIALMRVVRHKIEWATSIAVMKRVPEKTQRQRVKLLREIVDAIAARDPDRAAVAASASIDATYASYGWRRVIETRGTDADARG
jgi:DNA-binding GntR family transcriptional regulator